MRLEVSHSAPAPIAGLYAAAFLITMGINVPLNDTLAAAGLPDDAVRLADIRASFEDPWVFWNLVRTALSTGAFIALITATSRQPRAAAVSPRHQ